VFADTETAFHANGLFTFLDSRIKANPMTFPGGIDDIVDVQTQFMADHSKLDLNAIWLCSTHSAL
jgi:hypothetical protein